MVDDGRLQMLSRGKFNSTIEDTIYLAPMPIGFIPDTTGGADQYRCFVMDLAEEETFITQTQVLPGSPQVHHVLMCVCSTMAEAVEMQMATTALLATLFWIRFQVGYDYGFPTQQASTRNPVFSLKERL